jgi:hypothetical protein
MNFLLSSISNRLDDMILKYCGLNTDFVIRLMKNKNELFFRTFNVNEQSQDEFVDLRLSCIENGYELVVCVNNFQHTYMIGGSEAKRLQLFLSEIIIGGSDAKEIVKKLSAIDNDNSKTTDLEEELKTLRVSNILVNIELVSSASNVDEEDNTYPHHIIIKSVNGTNCHFRLSKGSENLIITTGDISDVDGFLALAVYAKSGADVIFIMNYPAYINEHNDTEIENSPGLGFKYNSSCVGIPKFSSDYYESKEQYDKLTSKYNTYRETHTYDMKKAMTDVAFEMATAVWRENSTGNNYLYFHVGGVNSFNPFSSKIVKNEVFVYLGAINGNRNINSNEDVFLDTDGREIQYDPYQKDDKTVEFIDPMKYFSVYIDFNGSAAFFNDKWKHRLEKLIELRKLRSLYIMGGVESICTAKTMPRIKGILNRLSCATMNQLYSPDKTYNFLKFLKEKEIDIYCISNNSMPFIDGNYIAQPRGQSGFITSEKVESFLNVNGLNSNAILKFARKYYFSPYSPPKKSFDLYSAMALVNRMKCVEKPIYSLDILYVDNVYGISLLSDSRKTFRCVVDDYSVSLFQNPSQSIEEEVKILRKINNDSIIGIPVFNLNIEYVKRLVRYP